MRYRYRHWIVYERRKMRLRMKRIAKAKREQFAGTIGLMAIIIGLITAGLNLPTAVPISFCATGAVTLVLTQHLSQRP